MRREHGMSVREIAIAVGVSRGTASLWLRDVPLTAEQTAALVARNPAYNHEGKGARVNAERARARRADHQADGRRRARERNPTYVGGCMLFWAEGSRSRNVAQLTNSDPAMVSIFADFLRRFFAVPDERFRLWCNLFADHAARIREVEGHWLAATRLPRLCLRPSTMNVYSRYSKRKRMNKLPYGTCRITVHSTEIVQTLYGSIQELAGIDRPEWLG
jgi:hypothetical protein